VWNRSFPGLLTNEGFRFAVYILQEFPAFGYHQVSYISQRSFQHGIACGGGLLVAMCSKMN
jgi:hypothetical protein